MSASKNPPKFQPRQRTLSTEVLNWMLNHVLRHVSGGRGINVRYFGNRIIIEQSSNTNKFANGSSSTETTTNWTYTAREK
jgi:hypothetical protein